MPSNEAKLRDYLKRVTADFSQVRQRLRDLEARNREPIAVVGVACRFPGGAEGPDGLWRLVDEGRDGIGPFPTDRGWADDLYDPDPDRPGKSYVVEGGFLPAVGDFDPRFFGISPREALAMDPQQRLLLEATWEAFEHAGIRPASVRGSRTGVFAGAVSSDYIARLASVPEEVEGFVVTGNMASILSGRIAYSYGLEGPAVTVDTACSSSLVSVHLAVQSLRQGESSLALACGVTVMPTPSGFVAFSRQRGLAPDGRCKSFAAAADGTIWSEGVGVVLLERLSDARRHGHRVLAVIRGSAANQDGASNGLSAPNELAQQRVIRAALENADLDPSEVDAVEAHGTGTTLGDPIEAQAVLATYGQGRPADRPLWLGSIKSNLGHSGAAAGIAGLLKMVLALRNGRLPRTLHVDEPSPHVDWSSGAVSLLTEPRDWPASDRPRRAAVSSFGISGTNAHVILEEAPAEPGPVTVPGEPVVSGAVVPWVLSARSAAAVATQAGRLAAAVDGADPVAVGWALAAERSPFEHRAVVWGAGPDALDRFASGAPAENAVTGVATSGAGVVFVFPGQGSQWLGMGRDLLASSPVFAARLAECSAALGWSVADVLTDDSWLSQVDVVQPVLWAVHVSLAAVWESLGVRPAAVVGHSQGEIAAAVVAGGLSLEDGARVVALRSRAIKAIAGRGGMLSLAAGWEQVEGWLPPGVTVAVVNSPTATVVSGAPAALDELAAQAEAQGVRARRVPVDYASHGVDVEEIRERIESDLAGITPGPSRVPLYSTVTGTVMDTAGMDGTYWFTNLRETVRFADAVAAVHAAGFRHWVEVSAHPVLTMAVEETIDAAVVTGTLRRDEGGPERLIASAAALWVAGGTVDWTTVFAGRTVERVDLPTYPFERQRYWLDAGEATGDPAGLGLGAAGHPLLGAAVSLAGAGGVLLTGRLSAATVRWLPDHTVAGTALLPGTGFVELAIRAGDEVGCGHLRELTLQKPLVLPGGVAVQVQVTVTAADTAGEREVRVHSRPDAAAEWVLHAEGLLAPDAPPAPGFGAQWPPAGAEPIDVSGFYPAAAEAGYGYGPAFQGLTAAWRRGDEVFAEVRLPEGEDAGGYGIHPALLDAALHANGFGDFGTGAGGLHLPFAWTGVTLHATGAPALRVRLSPAADGLRLEAADTAGRPVATVESLVIRPVRADQLGAAAAPDALFRVDWIPLPPAEAGPDDGWAALGDGGSFPDVASLGEAVAAGAPLPPVTVLTCAPERAGDLAGAARAATLRAWESVRDWVAEERLDGSRLVVVTRGAVAAGTDRDVPDLVAAPVWGLVRAAQSENPGRLLLVDLGADDDPAALPRAVAAAVAAGEPQVAVRGGEVLAPRLARPGTGGSLVPPAGGPLWRLEAAATGTLDGLSLIPAPEAGAPLAAGQVRVAMHAAGINFRDVLVGLGMVPRQEGIGGEVAGVVTEVGADVTDLAPGDRVMGIVDGGFGPVAVADARLLVPVPDGWSFARAATVPIAFLTAYYGLVDLARVRPGETVLVHAGAGGVGMAAVQLAEHLGARVFATASPSKWDTLRQSGVEDGWMASSRDLDFREAVLAVTDGVDVVLNSLAGEFVDASMDVLAEGGRFLELGKTDIREPGDHPGVAYHAYSPGDGGIDRAAEILRTVRDLLAQGVLAPLPVSTWDVRRAPEAFRHMAAGRHVGKVVLTMPGRLDPDGEVLVTGGTGTLGGLLARHLVIEHGARKLLLASRSGPDAPGATELVAELADRGAQVEVVACDAADRDQLEAVLAGRRLTGVVHATGLLDDGLVGSLTPERVERVLRSKVDGAVHLHELTADQDLALFVLYSSASGVFGVPGQSNYAAANTFLDALAQHRHARGLPGTSIAWGFWSRASGMTGHMDRGDVSRVDRSGLVALGDAEGLALFDAALGVHEGLVVATPFDPAVLRTQASAGGGHPLLRGLVRAPGRRVVDAAAPAGGTSALARELAGLSAAEARRVTLQVVRDNVAAVLGHADARTVEADLPFKELGFDSLTAVELRNRLNAATGLRLPATLVFDHPTPAVLAAHLTAELSGVDTPAAVVTTAAAVDEPIAIVGMACRLPGGVESPEDFWRLLADGVDAIVPLPTDRDWDLDGLYDPDPDVEGTMYVRGAGFIPDVADFDAGAFGISPREALAMDPQQRLLLEASWQAVERAGIAPASLRGSRTGIFAGCLPSEYAIRLTAVPEGLEGFLGTGNMTSVASGRIAYALGLEGPAMTVDTACSSSLVALHLAAQALRQGECELALAGGATVMSTPAGFIGMSRQRALAADGRCKAFAAAADGFGPAEGVAMLLVERLSDAQRNGHPVLALVRGSAVNQDGASNGLSAPNGPSQQRVIRAALASAGLAPSDVDAVEAHGTGTTLGDPIEAQALLATYGQDRPADRPLWLGSVKSNFGHTQAAAGVAGVMKMVLALRHGRLPRTLHVDAPSPHVDWSAGAVELLTEEREWAASDRPRRAGVSSFGISGTNAHVVLEEAPAAPESTVVPGTPALDVPVPPWVLSARSPAALAAQARQLATVEESVDAGWALVAERSAWEHRAVVWGGVADGLSRLASGAPAENVATGMAASGAGVVFVFPGQGSQWLGMGRELLASSPVFAARLSECSAALGWSVADVLAGADDGWLSRVDVVQPVLWAVHVSLAAVWESLGVRPAAVVGHSQGEIAAAVVAGGLSLADGARVVALRSRAIRAIAGRGGMLSLAAGREQVEGWLPAGVTVAAVNGPAATVVSGAPAALDELAAHAEAQGVRTRRVPVDYASHGVDVEEIRERIESDLAGLTPGRSRVPLYSTVTGEVIDTAGMDGTYWYTGLRETVRFADAVRAIHTAGFRHWVEVSAHPVLTMAVEETIDAAVVTGTLRRDDGGPDRLVASAANLWVSGGTVDWAALYAGRTVQRVGLPTYPFQRERYWLRPTAATGGVTAAGLGTADHPLLAAAVDVADDGGVLLTGRLSARSTSWLADHQVSGTVLFPGTGFVELAIRAGDEVGCGHLRELTLQAPLVVPESGAVQVQVSVTAADGTGDREVRVHSRPGDDGDWTLHADGVLSTEVPVPAPSDSQWPPAGAEPIDVSGFYPAAADAGYGYGPAFQGLTAAWRHRDEILAEVRLPDGQDAGGYGIHPALLDAALHANGFGDFGSGDGGLRLPFAWTGVTLHAAGAAALRVRIGAAGEDGVRVHATDPTGQPVATIESLVLRPVTAAQLRGGTAARDGLFRIDWTELSADAPVPAGWAVLGDDPLGLAAAVQDAGQPVDLYPDVPSLTDVLGAGVPAPKVVLAGAGDVAAVLDLLQRWLGEDGTASTRLAVVTRGAVAVGGDVPDLAHAPVWGLVRSAQTEHPDRLLLVDVDEPAGLPGAVAAALAAGETQLALRDGRVLVPRLARGVTGTLVPPAGEPCWRLDNTTPGTLDGLALLPCPEAGAPLAAGQVRLAVRAAGVNFRDVLIGLGMYPGAARIGSEAAGVVTEVGAGVTGLSPGDRVMGLVPQAMGPVAVADARALVPIPTGWSYEQAAGMAVVFLTAYVGLVDLADLKAGETVLVHAGAGGVGMAAIQLARQRGARVFATASPSKWDALRELGVEEGWMASSRDLGFREAVWEVTDGVGVDVVLNSLAGDFVDASLDVLADGGRFLEMGKTDLRDPAQVEAEFPGVVYRPYDAGDVEPDRLAEILRMVSDVDPLPVSTWDVRRAGEAFRHMAAAKHVGKVVLTMPPRLDPDKQVLITGGTGTLGGLIARHLVEQHGARRLLLVSRSGGEVPDIEGAEVEVAACDVSDRDQLAQLLHGRQLTGVVHAAGVLDDATIATMTPERLRRVMSKADAARHLHELTGEQDLAMFVLYSSAAGVLGSPGQGNYAAANTYLDALAAHRHATGRPATSLAWGYWATTSGLTDKIDSTERQRMAAGGLQPLTDAEGLALFDAALATTHPQLVTAKLRPKDTTHPLLRGLARPGRRTARAAGALTPDGLAGRLAGLTDPERDRYLLDVVRDHVATVLGHADARAVEAERPFQSLGLDSLTAVELRNRLNTATGLRLPATLVFDHPTPAALAKHLRAEVLVDDVPAAFPVTAELDRLEALLAAASADDLTRHRIGDRLRGLLSRMDGGRPAVDAPERDDVATATDDELFDLLDEELGAG